jgi:hypothetical protein
VKQAQNEAIPPGPALARWRDEAADHQPQGV